MKYQGLVCDSFQSQRRLGISHALKFFEHSLHRKVSEFRKSNRMELDFPNMNGISGYTTGEQADVVTECLEKLDDALCPQIHAESV